MEKKLKNGYTIVSNMTCRQPNGNNFCICDACLKKYPFLKEDVKKYQDAGTAYKSKEK